MWVNRYEREGTLKSRKCSGRNRITTQDQDNLIVQQATDQPFITAAHISRTQNVGPSTVRRRLNEAGIYHRIPAMQAKLTDQHRANRITFCEQNMGRDWDKVIFSDEKTFRSCSDRKLHLWRPRGERFNPNYVQSVKRSGRISCGVWGFITSMGVGEICEITPRMKSVEYLSILEDVLIPSRDIMFAEEATEFLFMQDNAGIHTSHLANAWFRSHPEITVLQWPALSPDLNPIENVWAKMVYDWNMVGPISRQTILEMVMQRWSDLIGDAPYINNLYRSMPKRLQEVIDFNGNWCSY